MSRVCNVAGSTMRASDDGGDVARRLPSEGLMEFPFTAVLSEDDNVDGADERCDVALLASRSSPRAEDQVRGQRAALPTGL